MLVVLSHQEVVVHGVRVGFVSFRRASGVGPWARTIWCGPCGVRKVDGAGKLFSVVGEVALGGGHRFVAQELLDDDDVVGLLIDRRGEPATQPVEIPGLG